MSKKKILPGLLALTALVLIWACDSANPVAPNGTTLTISANPTQIGLSGVSVISVSGFRPDGNRLNPGTQIQFSTSIGTLSSGVVSVDNEGRAVAVLEGTGQQGTATVRASTSGSESEAMIDVQIGESDETRPALRLTASPSTISPYIGKSTITVFARNADGSSVGAGRQIQLQASLGEIESAVTTDASGEAQAELTVPSDGTSGMVQVTASMAPAAEANLETQIEIRSPVLTLIADPTSIAVGGQSRITAIVRDTAGIALGSGIPISLVASGGELVSTTLMTGATGEGTTIFTAGLDASADATIQGFLSGADSQTATIALRDVASRINVDTDPSSVSIADGGSISVTATVQNAEGLAVRGVVVAFTAFVPNGPTVGNFTGGFTDVTETSGQASVTLSLSPEDITNAGLSVGQSFTVRATVATPNGEIDEDAIVTITN